MRRRRGLREKKRIEKGDRMRWKSNGYSSPFFLFVTLLLVFLVRFTYRTTQR